VALLLGIACGWFIRHEFVGRPPEPSIAVNPRSGTKGSADAHGSHNLATASVSPPHKVTPSAFTPRNLTARGLEAALAYRPHPPLVPGRWRCPSPTPCKYVQHVMVFRGFLGEQFSQQRLAVMETIHIVKALGPEYVLVEPLFIVTPHDNIKIEARLAAHQYANTEDTLLGRYILPASEIYDLQLLASYFPHRQLILWKDFQALSRTNGAITLDLLFMDHGPVDHTAIRCRDDDTLNTRAEFFNETYAVKRTRCIRAIRKEGYPLTRCAPRSRRCLPAGAAYRAAMLDSLRGAKGDTVGLFVYRSLLSERLYQWIEDPALNYVEIRKKLLFARTVWGTALRIVAGLLRPILAMHIRRGDKLSPDPYRTLDKAIARIRRVARQTRSRSVFVMTDIQNPDDLARLNRSLAAFGGVHRHSSTDWRREVQDMFVEMAVCCLSEYFIASGRAYWARDCAVRPCFVRARRQPLPVTSSRFVGLSSGSTAATPSGSASPGPGGRGRSSIRSPTRRICSRAPSDGLQNHSCCAGAKLNEFPHFIWMSPSAKPAIALLWLRPTTTALQISSICLL